ncbi:MAG: hypothetical protein BWX70_01233 [Verrucomicrobia bacterium ADurb.Bin070]|nr:MAG: hypothetical protein BWX70_01233 [Verrucomicrobia bacterium ADurb.Bin070]
MRAGRTEGVAVPALADGGRVGGGDGVPEAGHDVRIGQRLAVRPGFGGHHIDIAGGGEFEHALAGRDRAGGVVFDRRVAGAQDDGRAGAQAGVGGSAGGDHAGQIGRTSDAGEGGGRDAGQVAKRVRPASGSHVPEERALRLHAVAGHFAGQQVAHVVLDKQDVARALQCARLVVAQPQHLRQRPGRGRRLEGGLEDQVEVIALQGRALLDAALIGPDDGGAHHVQAAVEKHRAMRVAVERNGRDVAPPLETIEHVAHDAVPVGRGLFRPSRPRVAGGVFAGCAFDHGTGRVDDRHFAAARAEIDAEQEIGFHWPRIHLWSGSGTERNLRWLGPAMIQR